MQQMHRRFKRPQRPHLFSPLYHSNVGAGTAAASHLSRAVRPRPIPWLFISWMVGATGEYEEIRHVVRSQTPNWKKHLCYQQQEVKKIVRDKTRRGGAESEPLSSKTTTLDVLAAAQKRTLNTVLGVCRGGVSPRWWENGKIGPQGYKWLNGSSKSQWQRQVLWMQNQGPFMDSTVF